MARSLKIMKAEAFKIFPGYLTELDPAGVPATSVGAVGWVVSFAVGIGGVIATGFVIAGAIMMLTSAGEPNKIKEGQEMIVNALLGLAIILMSVAIVRIFGVDILAIPNISQYI